MFKLFISMLLILFSTMMFFLNHPLSMGLLLLLQTILISLISGSMINTFWFSYILFLTILGGLLVMFIYVASIASNEMFKFNSNLLLFYLMIMMTMFIIILMFNNLYWLNLNINSELLNFWNKMIFFNNENSINISKIYNNQSYFLTLMSIIYLLITLFAIIKIININYGPLRSN
uniref:NADH-ubiquinone oxidoreductase chain 6 n=1 Tax=Thitarodes renzhiensis TaxID=869563 RepID=I6LL83_9NEOP|nr:NADH dehydrogenase subunit 6 [Thitarodes renzhiensis]YP_010963448.1 NADH dehydrogenase subunit 6 [Thitarodes xunhuaensis]ADK97539.1 NADH dehydrogenase subunit 6 [Thitarodes renzhiensis]WNL54563.1 NADH dehydrogenase subunit 6 [Thitarodes xunhuaensis]